MGAASAEGENATEQEASADAPKEEAPSNEADVARARELFIEGVALTDRGEFSQAAERFEQALELHVAPTIRYNLAANYVQLDRRSEAAEQLDLLLADAETEEDLRTRGQQMLSEIEPQIGVISIDTSTLAPGATVTVEGRVIPVDQIDLPLRSEPGSYAVVATIDGEEVARSTAEVTAGATAEVTLEPTRSEVETSIVASTGDDEETPLIRDWRLWVGVGAGVAAIVIAVAVGVAVGGQDEFEDPIQGNMTPGMLTWP